MKRVGVVVEGPSDFVFWSRFFGRRFSSLGYTFDVRSMKGGSRVIQESSELTDVFYKAGYASCIFILDADKLPCATAVLKQFDEGVLAAARKQPSECRFVNIFIALREIESWLLADEICIQQLLSLHDYRSTSADSQRIAGKGKLLQLCREQSLFPAGMKDRECARQAAGFFDPERAAPNSPSCSHFWNRLSARLK